ncbi:hypothetical protein R1sor_005731 [Riccia sorocarpa]|uniref:BZIP domain-containing protein n=1 Tax=Riccia sorocarpa TaxID=122646 RepID=A0ABD3HP86_9MARC
MASGVTELPSIAGGGKFSHGRRRNRKIAGRKVFLPKGILSKKNVGIPRSSLAKRKDMSDDEDSGDFSPELDAARALTMFSQMVEEGTFSQQTRALFVRTESPASLPQWSRKRRRSSRPKRTDCSSENSRTNSEPSVELESEAASSLVKDSHSSFSPIKAETVSECLEEGCASDSEKQSKKLFSEPSSDLHQLDSRGQSPVSPLPTDFQLCDSRGESPTSPLPAALRKDDIPIFAVLPQLEEGEGRSAFQKVVPIRPLRKSAVVLEPKVEKESYEATTPEQAVVKVVPRKKPRLTTVTPLPVVKTEGADAGRNVNNPTIVPSQDSTRFEDVKYPVLTAPAVEPPFLEALVKTETKPSVKSGQRNGGKTKAAITEIEKEARRQRRVQANRESARQTIRRKQVLCEELSAKSHFLSNENELLRHELKLKLMELKQQEEVRLHLKAQLVQCGPGTAGSEFASSDKAGDISQLNYPRPPLSFGQLHMPPLHPLFWYAQAYAQAAQTAGIQQASDITLPLSGESGNGFSSHSVGMSPGYWVGVNRSGSQGGGQSSPLPQFFSHPSVMAGVRNFSPCSGETAVPSTAAKPVVSFPATQTEGSLSRGGCGEDRAIDASKESAVASMKSLGMYRTSMFRDTSSDAQNSTAKRESLGEVLTAGSKNSGFSFTSAVSQAGTQASCAGVMLTRKPSGELSGEDTRLSLATGHLSRASSGNLASQVSKIPNSRFMYTDLGRRYPDMLGMGFPAVMMGSSRPSAASVKAAEARRRRKEVQRSRSLFHRRAARAVEPPVP